jgi:hypothetical protein
MPKTTWFAEAAARLTKKGQPGYDPAVNVALLNEAARKAGKRVTFSTDIGFGRILRTAGPGLAIAAPAIAVAAGIPAAAEAVERILPGVFRGGVPVSPSVRNEPINDSRGQILGGTVNINEFMAGMAPEVGSAIVPGAGSIAGAIGRVLGRAGAAVGIGTAACAVFPSLPGCGGSAVTPVTSQVAQVPSGPAPKASLILGSCPPGRVRRKVAWGRDICARRPHMNVLNPHALRRAARRIGGFQKQVRSIEKLVNASMKTSGARRTRCVSCKKTRCSCR